MKFDTQTIDKLFLELSQFTSATTRKELELSGIANKAIEDVRTLTTQLKSLREQLGKAERILGEIKNFAGDTPHPLLVKRWHKQAIQYFADVDRVVTEFPKND
jgi:hypothetical protein